MESVNQLNLVIVTPKKKLLDDQCKALSVTGYNGELGILPGHCSLLTNLGIGSLVLTKENDQKDAYFINSGFMEIQDNRVLILTETSELSGEIDTERAQKALERARDRMKNPSDSVDIDRAEIALKRALSRLNIAKYK